ncbi:venom protease-like [Copidosoma floridanum]|uniref:venom protease-like n=1 Tax=Copidosoma floridanum TaxID=29053 RepID=UPI0006C9CB78|nr:venom protease-like [Copidosoma floridanum]
MMDQTLVNAQSLGSECHIKTQRGSCQLLTKCGPALDDLKAGKRPEVVCGFDKLIPIVCCPIKGATTASPTTPSKPTEGSNEVTTTGRPFEWDPNMRRSEQMCQEYSKLAYTQKLVIRDGIQTYVNVSACGVRMATRIVGGNEAEPKEFPHMAAIGFVKEKNDPIRWNCGGALISDLWVLTAAHCTYSFEWGFAEYVRVGDLNLASEGDDAKPQERRVSKRIRHPGYKKPAEYNDIALFKMDRPVTFDAYVRPACLSLNPDVQSGERMTVAGWGIVHWTNEEGSPILMKVHIPVASYDACKGYYGNEPARLPKGINSESQLCAGEDGKDACQGDSGGPLMVKSDSYKCMYDIVGVTSFGKLCGSVIPGVYTKVYHYLDWIEDTVWP